MSREDDDSTTVELDRVSEHGEPSIRPIARVLGQLRDEHIKERGARGVWRLLGTIAATMALSIGGYALKLATQASADHETLIDVRSDVAANEGSIGAMDHTLRNVQSDVAFVKRWVDTQIETQTELERQRQLEAQKNNGRRR